MIQRFELTGDLRIAPGRGRQPIAPEIEVAVAMAENAGRIACNWSSSSSSPRSNSQIPSYSNFRIMLSNPGTERGPSAFFNA